MMKNQINQIEIPHFIQKASVLISVAFSILILLIIFLPWVQTSQGSGKVIALNPNERIQSIESLTEGRIEKWFATDGAKVKKGQPIVQIIDNDPRFLERLRLERDAAFDKNNAAIIAAETAKINVDRQNSLLKQGLTSKLKLEKAKISYKKLLAEVSSSSASLAKAETKLAQQNLQIIKAPSNGSILRVTHGLGNISVKKGTKLATFVPEVTQPAIEVFVDGRDLPLIHKNRNARIQIEGWPAVQFSGWPMVAIGTFPGKVSFVDASVSANGKFRVVIVPPEKNSWPSLNFLRQGARVHAWISLNTVRLGYEVWRQVNDFPVSVNNSSVNIDKKKSKI